MASESHPAGSGISVYYNPTDPAEALISPGVSAGDLFVLLCTWPFNLVMLGGWGMLVSALRRKRAPKGIPEDMRISDQGTEVRLRPSRMMAVVAAAVVALLVSFLSIVVIAFATGGAPTGSAAVVGAWGAVVTSSIVVYRSFASDKNDLVIDRVRGTLTLPGNIWSPPSAPIHLSDIVEVDLRADARHSERKYSCLVRWKNAEGNTAESTCYFLTGVEQNFAELLVAWLRKQCSLEARNPQ